MSALSFRLARPSALLAGMAVFLLGACGGRAPTDMILPGGIPARTDLQAASTLPPDSARLVARKDAGWRVIYHPARAPAGADQRAAAALCGLERKRPLQIIALPMSAPLDDPGAHMIDIICG